MNRRSAKVGLARIVAQPPEVEYHVEQFLGTPPPVVPAVLTDDLRTPHTPRSHTAHSRPTG